MINQLSNDFMCQYQKSIYFDNYICFIGSIIARRIGIGIEKLEDLKQYF